jgi:hypothetical protein
LWCFRMYIFSLEMFYGILLFDVYGAGSFLLMSFLAWFLNAV